MRPSESVLERSQQNLVRHRLAEQGKVDLLKTWDEMRDGKIENKKQINLHGEHDYLVELGKRIRRERVLVSHIKLV